MSLFVDGVSLFVAGVSLFVADVSLFVAGVSQFVAGVSLFVGVSLFMLVMELVQPMNTLLFVALWISVEAALFSFVSCILIAIK